ncbi:replicative DNA helicase [Lysinibacillus capsici]|uniref:replicative DNA helicase n=1 Tax=Lysinibacillus TaxID=400634 RepID=UPI002E1CBDC4|nr:replicative DNA helicase [Lysinibacillus capsici]
MIQTHELSIELAEKSLLGIMLVENYLISDSGLDSEHFTSQIHRNIFSCMQELASAGKTIDYITLMTMREPMELGGANYLAELSNFANTVKFDNYREILVAHWRERKKAFILQQAQQEAWTIDNIQKALDDIQGSDTEQNTSIMIDLVELGDTPYKKSAVRKGVTSGLSDLDKMLNGFQRKELTIVAARPSMGKTDTLDHFAMAAGWAGYLPIIFSLEMSRETLLNRLIAAAGNFNRLKMRNPYEHFSEEQKNNWLPTLTHLSNTKIEIDDRAGLTVAQIRASARKIIKANPNRQPIIFIDYLQIIRGANPKDNQTQIIGQISWDLKQMAKEFDCPVVCLSQLNRSVEARQDKRPMMSDLRDSGNIEQDADVIMFLYRDDYYDKESESKNMLEFIIAKHRNGPTGTVMAVYIKETGRLANVVWGQGGSK